MRKSSRRTALEPITVIFSWEVRKGKEAAFMDWLHGIAKAATRWPGHMGVTTLRPPQGQGLYHSVLRFDTDEHLKAWLDSVERHKWIKQLEGIAVAHSAKATGLENWFDLPGSPVVPPPKWKMVITTFIAIYPLSLLYSLFLTPHVTHLPAWVRALFLPVLAPIILTYLFMPFLTRRVLKRWLYKG